MKKFLLLLAMVVGLAACSPPSEVSLPDSNVKYQNGVVTYKDKPYTGKITTNVADKLKGYSGFVNLKEGHLDGLTEIKKEDGEMVKITIVNGKFDGDYLANAKSVGNVAIKFKQGGIKSIKMTPANPSGMSQDITVADDGKLNGTIKAGGQTITFKEGVANMNGLTMKATMTNEGKMSTEVYRGDKLMQKNESGIDLTPKALEEQVFGSVFNNQ